MCWMTVAQNRKRSDDNPRQQELLAPAAVNPGGRVVLCTVLLTQTKSIDSISGEWHHLPKRSEVNHPAGRLPR
jgi:hypothetical protein